MEDGISGGLQHRHMMCCEKGSRHGRRACRVQRWHHHGDVVFRTGGLVYDKGLEMIIDVQRMVKDIKRMAEEANTTITEVEGSVLTASINNKTMNATNIAQISEDL